MSLKESTTLYLVRHAQSHGNFAYENELPLPQTDAYGSHLTDLGKQQAVQLAHEFRHIHFDAIFSSTLTRAHQTAIAVATERKIEVQKLRDLQEQHKGNETDEQALTRFLHAFTQILSTWKNSTILVVSHGAVMRLFLYHIQYPTPQLLKHGDIQNTGYVVLEHHKKEFRVKRSSRILRPNRLEIPKLF